MAKLIMVQGTCSNAGKSLLCAALCRIFRQDGYRVAPFKSQNMALNSFITADGREMGRAQVVQAEAAGIAPDVRMNPILLKPTSDVGSQVIIMGEAHGNRTAREYWGHKKALLPVIKEAFDSLAAENDIIVIEGAGSPAEINLKQDDIVNMGLAKLVDAPVLLVGDIDRGGVFASLYGTVKLLALSDVSASWLLVARRDVADFFSRTVVRIVLVVLLLLILAFLFLRGNGRGRRYGKRSSGRAAPAGYRGRRR